MRGVTIWPVVFLLILVACAPAKTSIPSSIPDVMTNTIREIKPHCLTINVDNPLDCPEVISFLNAPRIKERINCSREQNYNIERLYVDRGFLDYLRDSADGKTTYVISDFSGNPESNLGDFDAWAKWYPSLKEGYITGYPFSVYNLGCTKIKTEDLKSSIYTYHTDVLIAKNEFAHDEWGAITGIEYIYPDNNIQAKVSLKPYSEKLNLAENGSYPITLIVYYQDKVIGVITDTIRLK